MEFIELDIRKFSEYALTYLFYVIKPIAIFYKGNKLKVIANDKPFYLSEDSAKILDDIKSLKGYQPLEFKKINNNYYTSLNKKSVNENEGF